jgi:hypothetical protein
LRTDFDLIRPGTFVDGHEYFLKERFEDKPALIPVKFIAYDPCPAFVIVRKGSGRQRCLRDDLFIDPGVDSGNSAKSAEAKDL